MPFLGFFIVCLFGRFLGYKGSSFISILSVFVSFIFSLFIFYEAGLCHCTVYLNLGCWIRSEFLSVDWGFLFDSLTATMCVVITLISLLVHFYSTEYMANDPHLPRFMSYLSLFTFFMLVLVTGDNYLVLFVGWEGVGLCSYLLINFWYSRIQANKAAIKAMLVNRVGDFGLLIAILFMFKYYKAVDYSTVFAMTPYFVDYKIYFFAMHFRLIDLISFFIFIGAMGKSAQLGLHTWLPDAMEGPTPVSALIHAATMVTAGIFVIVRSSPIIEYSPDVLGIIAVIGATTAVVAAVIGLFQNDLKKVIAYSTCSQLGYMMFSCGLSNYGMGMFHLVNHAFFKALLFLAAGSVIHAVSDEQDMRKLGGLKKLIPFTYSVMVIGSLALTGFPFLSGFYSKDAILESSISKYSAIGTYCYISGTLAAFLTAFYSVRLIYLTFLTRPNGYKPVITKANEPSDVICVVLGILAVLSIFSGYFLKDLFIGLGTDFWGNAIFVLPENMNQVDAEFIPTFYKLLPVFFSIAGTLTSFLFYSYGQEFLVDLKMDSRYRKFYNFFNRKFFFDKFYSEFLGQFFFKFGYNINYKLLDKGVFEMFGAYGISTFINKKSKILSKLESTFLYHYTLLVFGGVVFLLGYRQFWLLMSPHDIYYKIFVICYISFIFVMEEDGDELKVQRRKLKK